MQTKVAFLQHFQHLVENAQILKTPRNKGCINFKDMKGIKGKNLAKKNALTTGLYVPFYRTHSCEFIHGRIFKQHCGLALQQPRCH